MSESKNLKNAAESSAVESVSGLMYEIPIVKESFGRWMDEKNPWMLAIINLVIIGFPGFGHTFLKPQLKKAERMLLLALLIDVFVCLSLGFATPLLLGYHLFAAIDVFVLARRVRKGKTIGPWEFFWNR